MGLLDRALPLAPPPGERVGVADPQTISEEFIRGLENNSGGLDVSVTVFAALRDVLSIEKGAILLPELPGGDFVPWALEGYDRTTARRLRIPPESEILHFHPSLLHRGEDAKVFLPFLSNREAGLTDRVLMMPLPASRGTEGWVVITEAPLLHDWDDGWEAALAQIGEAIGTAIEENRTGPLSRMGIPVYEEAEIPLNEWLQRYGDSPAMVVHLDITEYLDRFMTRHPEMEGYRIQRDVETLISALTGRMGTARLVEAGRILLLFPRERFPMKSHYLRQVAGALGNSFPESPGEIDLKADFWEWPEERRAVEKSLTGYF